MIVGDRADDRIAAGQRMVGEEQHRLAAMGHLDCARRSALARQFGLVLAFQRHIACYTDADTVGLRRHLPELGGERGDARLREPVAARSHDDIERHRFARCRMVEGRGLVQRYRREIRPFAADRHDGASHDGVGADDGQRIGGGAA
ncbi:hypothetical protein D3C87_1769570 [compost metagenome]